MMQSMKDTPQARLLLARKEANVSGPQIAEHVGISIAEYGDLEAGLSQDTRHLVLIADYLGVNPLWLAAGKEPKTIDKLRTNPKEATNTEMLQMLASLSTQDLNDIDDSLS